MKNKFKFFAMGLVSLIGLSLASCSDDDDPKGPENVGEPTTENVFTEGLPSNVAGAIFTTNDKGQLTKMDDGYETITFEYGTFTPSRASHNYTVLMKVRYDERTHDGYNIYMELNDKGFAKYAYEIDLYDNETEEWEFEYNADSQLTCVKSTGNKDEYNITYANGDIAEVVKAEDDGDRREFTIKYTNDDNKTVVPNKGCIMLFYQFFHVDMDEMESAYFAGLLGKPTKNLPMGYTESSKKGGSSYTYEETYHWDFNANKLPTKFWSGDYEYEGVTFSWK